MLDSLNLDDLQADGFQTAEELPWLNRSYTDPKVFFVEFMADYQNTCGVAVKSTAFGHYDFYYDIFEKSGNADNSAYTYYDVNGRRHVITYGDLKQLVDHKADDWGNKGVTSGDLICLVYPLGLEFTVGLIAALKLGLILSFASPARPWLMKKQVAALAPDYISTSPAYTALLANEKEKLVESLPYTGKGTSKGERARVYQTGQVAARLFDFSLETLLEPVDISCDALYLNTLRDGVLALNLGPKETLAAPGWSCALTQPFMLLSVLLTGAAFLDLKPELYRRMPKMLLESPPSILGVDEEFRQFLLTQPPEVLSGCKFWFRSPFAGSEFNDWQTFITKMGLEERFTGVLKWHTQAGGILAFSRRRKGLAMDNLMPSAGTAWQLVPLPEGGMLPSPAFGLLSFVSNGLERTTPYLFVKNGVEWIAPSSYLNEKGERFYSRQLVESFLKATKFNRPFLIVPVQRVASKKRSYDLVIFTGSRRSTDQADVSKKIIEKITHHLGREYSPDHVVFLPLLPRLAPDGSMDTEWCQREYTTHRLNKKAAHKVFAGISRLKEIILIQNKLKVTTT
jgi:hypothetical protein